MPLLTNKNTTKLFYFFLDNFHALDLIEMAIRVDGLTKKRWKINVNMPISSMIVNEKRQFMWPHRNETCQTNDHVTCFVGVFLLMCSQYFWQFWWITFRCVHFCGKTNELLWTRKMIVNYSKICNIVKLWVFLDISIIFFFSVFVVVLMKIFLHFSICTLKKSKIYHKKE